MKIIRMTECDGCNYLIGQAIEGEWYLLCGLVLKGQRHPVNIIDTKARAQIICYKDEHSKEVRDGR